MKAKKKAMISVLTGILCAGSSFSAMAGTWQKDSVGWWWREDNGSYPANTWQWIDGDRDGTAECYYFDHNGYCLMNTVTPDGYQVNASGAWVVNGVVQRQGVSKTITAKETEAIYQRKLSQYKSKYRDSVLYEAEYLIRDFNQDGIGDLLIFQHRRTEEGFFNEAELYTIVNGELSLCDSLTADGYGGTYFGASQKDGYILVSFCTSRYSDYIYSITPSLTFMQEVYYTTHGDAGKYGEIYENANHIYRGYIHATDIDEGTTVTMTELE